jgi:hypothetical protein
MASPNELGIHAEDGMEGNISMYHLVSFVPYYPTLYLDFFIKLTYFLHIIQ